MSIKSEPIVAMVRNRLENHPHFRGRSHLLAIEAIGTSVIVSGRVPTFYLKQLLQEAIRTIPDVAHVNNCVDVSGW